jgi:hypothetical protein
MFPAYTTPVKTWGTFGASIVYLSYGTSTATSSTGEDLGTFTSYEIAPTLSYGTKVMEGLGIGGSFKYVRVSLAPEIAGLPGAGQGSTGRVRHRRALQGAGRHGERRPRDPEPRARASRSSPTTAATRSIATPSSASP